ncbi:MAG: hypothetical protein LBT02_03850, partial [Rickettsiales bacterium]|nr:hypothetical protein [Rickettsiales bacterium]
MKRFFKWLFYNRGTQFIVVWFIHFYIWLVCKTSKITIKGNTDKIKKYLKTGKGLVLFTWHGRILLAPMVVQQIFKDHKISVLSSARSEGQIAGKLSNTFGINNIIGYNVKNKNLKNFKNLSNKRREEFHERYGKNITSMREIMKRLKEGDLFLLAADAPKGPAYKFNSSLGEIVKKMDCGMSFGVPSCKRKKIFKSWDKFEFPYPFNEIVFEFGAVYTTKTANLEKKAKDDINTIMGRNDRSFNNSPPP